jgi:DNA polymerase sigma
VQAGRGEQNLGNALLSFMLLYGRHFKYEEHAVAVRLGGILPVASVNANHAVQDKTYTGSRIYVEDPLTFRQLPCHILMQLVSYQALHMMHINSCC